MRTGVMASLAARGVTIVPPAPTFNPYEQLVRSIPNLVSFWPFNNITALTDVKGGLNGIFTGSGQTIVSSLAANSDGTAVNFPGTAAAIVPHSAPLLLPAFTLSTWLKQNTLPLVEVGAVMPILTKDMSVNTDGDLSIFVDTEGTLVVRMQNGITSFTLSGPITLGLNNHLGIYADATGFGAYLNAQHIGDNSGVTSGLSNNLADLTFAFAAFLAYTHGNCVLDATALYSRVLDQDEFLALSQRTQPPIAVGGTASVPESATTEVDVLANDSWSGKRSELAITIRSNPGTPHSVNVNANKNINFVAGDVGSDPTRSFSYDVADPLGISNIAIVDITVLGDPDIEPLPPTSLQANCYTENTSDVRRVTTMAALETEVNAAPPGRTILVAANTNYTGGTRTFNRKGTATNPIVIRPEDGPGTVVINDANWTLAGASERLVFSKFFMNRSNFNVNGIHNRITRNQFRQIDGAGAVNIFAATDTRIDHNDYSGYLVPTVAVFAMWCIKTGESQVQAGTLRNVLIDYEYFHDFPSIAATLVNQAPFITGGAAGAWNIKMGEVIDHCLFLNADSNTSEFINIKSKQVKVRYSTFINTDSYLQSRAGGGCEFRSNWFEAMGSARPLTVWDEWAAGGGPALVIGNRVVNQDIWIGAGSADLAVPDTHETGPYPYHRCRETQVIGNIARAIIVGAGTAPTHPALNCNVPLIGTIPIYGNNVRTLQLESGTKNQNPATTTFPNVPLIPSVTPWYDFTPAVKLTAANVGRSASDPLCPTGPQF